MRLTAPCAARSASESANKCAKRSAGRPVMRKFIVHLHLLLTHNMEKRWSRTHPIPVESPISRFDDSESRYPGWEWRARRRNPGKPAGHQRNYAATRRCSMKRSELPKSLRGAGRRKGNRFDFGQVELARGVINVEADHIPVRIKIDN